MNTYMWEHPLTAEQTDKLKSWGYIEIPVTEKTLMCGDKGMIILYKTVLSFNDPNKEDFRKLCGKGRKCWYPAFSPFSFNVFPHLSP